MPLNFCQACGYSPCQCDKDWAAALSPETHARGEMVRRNLPWGQFLRERLPERNAEIDRLTSLQPQHLPPDQLLELYLLELIEALKIERTKRGG